MGMCHSFDTFCSCTEPETSKSKHHAEKLIRKRHKRFNSSELRSFHDAIAIGNKPLVMSMLQQNLNGDLINSKYNEQSPLTCAVINKQYKILQYLLDQDASPNVRDGERGDTPLHIAVGSGDLEAVQILCTYKVDRSITNEYNETAMDIALEKANEHRDIASYLEPATNDTNEAGQGAESTPNKMRHQLALDISSINVLVEDTSVASMASYEDSSLDDVAGDLLDDVEEELTLRSQSLKPLEGWLERKQHSPPYAWLKRWVVVHKPYMLWSERLMNIEVEHVDTKEKKRWNKCICIKKMEVEPVTGDKNRRFKVRVKDKENVFRAKNKKTRDYWVENLRETIDLSNVSALVVDKRISSKMQRMLTTGH